MRTYSSLLAMCFVSGVAIAQESTPTSKAEVGLNYSHLYVTMAQSTNANQSGGSGYLEYNLNKVVSLVADFGGYADRNTITGANTGTNVTYLPEQPPLLGARRVPVRREIERQRQSSAEPAQFLCRSLLDRNLTTHAI
jgi:hypothetical protein